MSFKPGSVLAIAAAAIASAVVVSAPAAGTSAPTSPLLEKRVVLRKFADCVVRGAERRSLKVLRTDPGSRDEHEEVHTLVQSQAPCLGDRSVLSMHTAAIRGVIAEAVFARHGDWLQSVSAMPAAAPVRVAGKLEVEPFMVAYAGCIAKAEPAKAAAVLATEPTTAAERSAVLGLGDTLKDCMAIDVAYHLNIGDLRTHLASALFLEVPQSVTGA